MKGSNTTEWHALFLGPAHIASEGGRVGTDDGLSLLFTALAVLMACPGIDESTHISFEANVCT